jgi:phosphohistidine phosphatase
VNLYLVQHGEAKTKAEDSDRALTDAGKELSEKTACFAAEQARVSVDAVLHSGKTRAQETSEIMAAYLCPAKGVSEEKNLSPNDDPHEWAARLEERLEDIMLVGHLPHLSRLASILLTGNDGKDVIDFQNSGIVSLKRGESGLWRLNWMVVPEILAV